MLKDFIKQQFTLLKKELDSGKMGDSLSSQLKYSARNNFKLDKKEEVIYAYSTALLDDDEEITQGIVITDLSINIIVDNDSPNDIICVLWEDLKSCDYKDMVLYFHNIDDMKEILEIHLSFFRKTELGFLDSVFGNKQEIDCDKIGVKLAKIFNVIIEEVNRQVSEDNKEGKEIVLTAFNLLEKKEWVKLNEFIDEKMNESNVLYNIFKAKVLEEKDHLFNEALKYCNIASKIIDGDDKLKNISDITNMLYLLRSSIYKNLEEYNLARKDILMITSDNMETKEDEKEKINEINSLYNQHFYELPYDERKIIMITNKNVMNIKGFTMLDINNMPKNMILPLGHPKDGMLYLGHPFIKNKYIPMENYEIELLEDKIREFCELVESLGATEVYVESISSTIQNNKQINNSNKEIDDNMITGIEAKIKTNQSDKFEEQIKRTINISQKFNPKSLPVLPQDLNWYGIEYSWQRLYNQRMRGSLIEHREKFETRKVSLIEENEIEDVNAGIDIFVANMNGKYDRLKNKVYHTNENVEIILHVKFAPLDSLK